MMRRFIRQIRKVANIWRNKKQVKEKQKNKKSLLYINKPIRSMPEDVIGYETHIRFIKEAINKGANIIGIIANYGQGKSSIIELLKSEGKYNNPIIVNMWDVLHDINNEKAGNNREYNDEDDRVSLLIKSFLYQLAQNDNRLRNYVNKRLKGNTSPISISTKDNKTFVYVLLCVLSIIVLYIFLLPTISYNCNYIIVYIVVIMIICLLYCILRKDSLIVSITKPESRNKMQINDCYQIFEMICENFKKNNKKQLIVIEDLDRINDRNIIERFLKELYRYNNKINDNIKSKIVFLVSIKSETSLNGYNNENLYPKIFDYMIHLMPVQYNNYEQILENLVKSCEDTEISERLLDENERLIDEISWLKRGENLTIRDLKERLNYFALLYYSFKDKEYKNVEADDRELIKKCASVTYLKYQYSEIYDILISKQDLFNKAINSVVNPISNNESVETQEVLDLIDSIKEELGKREHLTIEIDDFYEDFCVMLEDANITIDYSMFFYSYPKGSYIMNSYEYELYDLTVRSPLRYYKDEKEYYDNIINNIEDDGLVRICNIVLSSEIKFSAIFMYNEKMLNIILNNRRKEEMVRAEFIDLIKEIFDISSNSFYDRLKYSLTIINNYDYENARYLLDEISNVLHEKVLSKRDNEVIKNIRLVVIENIKEEYIKSSFQNLFKGDNMPLITQEELGKLEDTLLKLDLIYMNKITVENVEYILDFLNNIEECKNDINMYEVVKDIYIIIYNKNLYEEIEVHMLKFLLKNKSVEIDMLKIIKEWMLKIEKEQILSETLEEYLNIIDIDDWNSQALEIIDDMQLNLNISNELLQKLYDNKLIRTYILSKMYKKELDTVKYVDEYFTSQLLEYLPTVNTDKLLKIRLSIVERNDSNIINAYKNLFYGNYPFITLEEAITLNKLEDLLFCFDKTKFSNNKDILIEYVDKRKTKLTKKEYFDLIKWLKESNINNNVVEDVIFSINYINVYIETFETEDLENIVNDLNGKINIKQSEKAIKFMNSINRLIPSLELEAYRNIDNYIELINNIKSITDTTIMLIDKELLYYPFEGEINSKLLKNEMYNQYIIGSILKNGDLLKCDYRMNNWNGVSKEQYFEIFIMTIKKVKERNNISNNQLENMNKLIQIMKDNSSFMQQIINNNVYIDLTVEEFEFLHNKELKYTFEFIKWIIENAKTQQTAVLFTGNWKFKTQKDNDLFVDYILDDNNINIMEDEYINNCILDKLYENDGTKKQEYKEKRNEYFVKKDVASTIVEE